MTKRPFIFEYLNEAEFKKRERSLKKYNMFAFKKLVFDFYPEMKEGNFLGEKVLSDDEKKIDLCRDIQLGKEVFHKSF